MEQVQAVNNPLSHINITHIIIAAGLIFAFLTGYSVAGYDKEIKYQDPGNPEYSITFYPSTEYPGFDGKFEINEAGDINAGKYIESPNSYGLYMANGLGSTIEKTGNGIKTLEGFEWIRN
jgi:hypothetical protein